MPTSVLPFLRDYDVTKLTKTSYKQTVTRKEGKNEITETKKKSIPVIPAGASKHTVIYCISEFRNAAQTLSWVGDGDRLFENILSLMPSKIELKAHIPSPKFIATELSHICLTNMLLIASTSAESSLTIELPTPTDC